MLDQFDSFIENLAFFDEHTLEIVFDQGAQHQTLGPLFGFTLNNLSRKAKTGPHLRSSEPGIKVGT